MVLAQVGQESGRNEVDFRSDSGRFQVEFESDSGLKVGFRSDSGQNQLCGGVEIEMRSKSSRNKVEIKSPRRPKSSAATRGSSGGSVLA